MIALTIKYLQADKWYNVSEEVEIAKGKYQYVTKLSKAMEQAKRIQKFKKKS